jgi:hypothetical protein
MGNEDLEQLMSQLVMLQTKFIQGLQEQSSQALVPSNIPFPKPLYFKSGSKAGNFEKFEKQWKDYLVACDLEKSSEDKKVAILRLVLGEEALEVLETLVMPLTANEVLTPKKILEELKKAIVPTDNLIHSRYNFSLLSQGDEKFAEFLVKARQMNKECDWNKLSETSLEDEMLKGKLICGIKNEKLRKQFLMDKKVTLLQVVEKCKISEETDERIASTAQTASTNINKLAFSDPSNNGKCKFCGLEHPMKKILCPANNKICNKCGEKGHFATRCPESKKIKQVALQDQYEYEDYNDWSDGSMEIY